MADKELAVDDVLGQIGAVVKEAIQTHGWPVTATSLCVIVARAIHMGEHIGGERNALLGNWLYGMQEQLTHLNGKCDAEKIEALRRGLGKFDA